MRATYLYRSLAALLLSGCSAESPTELEDVGATGIGLRQGGVDTPIISGTWRYAETSVLVVRPEREVIQITCVSPAGILTILQDGSEFTGTLTHPTSSCTTRDGLEIPPPWPMPYQAIVSGRVTGRALHIHQYDAPPEMPVQCPSEGVVRVVAGEAVELITVGRCDLSFVPFRPAVARHSARATRG